MAEQKYRYLKEGDTKVKGYQFRHKVDVYWNDGEDIGAIIGRFCLDEFEFRVPITEEEPKMCEMVLGKEVCCLEKKNKALITYKSALGSFYGLIVLPLDFDESPIGTIWDNVNGKPVRRPTVEKCAVCGCEASSRMTTYENWYTCTNGECISKIDGRLEFWNKQQKAITETLKKAGWVRP